MLSTIFFNTTGLLQTNFEQYYVTEPVADNVHKSAFC